MSGVVIPAFAPVGMRSASKRETVHGKREAERCQHPMVQHAAAEPPRTPPPVAWNRPHPHFPMLGFAGEFRGRIASPSTLTRPSHGQQASNGPRSPLPKDDGRRKKKKTKDHTAPGPARRCTTHRRRWAAWTWAVDTGRTGRSRDVPWWADVVCAWMRACRGDVCCLPSSSATPGRRESTGCCPRQARLCTTASVDAP